MAESQLINIRNPHRNDVGTIDCEIEHPKLGWVPFTANPEDSEQHGRDIYDYIIKNMDIA